MLTQSRWNRLLALALVLPLAACAGEEEPDVGIEGDPLETEPAPTTGDEMGMAPMNVTLEAVNESGVSGEATVRQMGSQLTVDANVSDATEDGEYPAHIHSGSCPSPGGVIAPLESVQVTGGQGMSTSTVDASQIQGEAAVQIHRPDGQPIACGDLDTSQLGGMEGMGTGMDDTTGM